MNDLKSHESKLVPIKILITVAFIFLLWNLSREILFWWSCKEQDRNTPPNTEVIISACKSATVIGVPGGDMLFVQEGRSDNKYLLDLSTGKEREVPNDSLLPSKGIFLNSELMWLSGSLVRPGATGYRPHYILDLTNGQRYELLDLDLLPRLEDGSFDPKNYVYFTSAAQVFLHPAENILIALSSDFRTNPSGRVIFSGYSIGTERGELILHLMKNLDVKYELVDLSALYYDVPSPTGKYFVRYDGIYLSKTNTLVMREWEFVSWYYDESGVIVQNAGSCKIPLPGANCLYYVMGPVLKLHLPLSP